jgi:hypothetical protein
MIIFYLFIFLYKFLGFTELALVAFLQANADVFAWEPSQMPGIPREVIEHHLKIIPNAKPVSQKPRR